MAAEHRPHAQHGDGAMIQGYTVHPLVDHPADIAAIAALYERIWGRFNARTEVQKQLGVPGFTGRVAHGADGTLVGYVYGITAQPDDRAMMLIRSYLTPIEAEQVLLGSFFVAELAVAPTHGRRGIGAALMREVLAACSHDRATTCTEHYNAPARALYNGLGFVTLVEHMKFSPDSTSSADDFIVLRTPLPLPTTLA
jgi:ribosomal protein S18 acetylase RimI-like enzyme